ncbi:serine-rich protein-related [Striga hermonthica]|uniref:Serine-rich protein-related n=1 Tax=Striga hermonthica TaxID=68872 RepID=A0A9N7P1V6_STRHE|nr:serine-rich protein-related [Striga hermonthica]
MATSSRRSNSSTALRRSGPLYISTASDPSPFTSSSTPTFASSTSYYSTTSPSAGFFNHHRSASPTRVSLHALSPPPPTTRLNMRRSAMTSSLVRIGTVEGDLVKRALAALIRPSSHQQRRREDFRPRPSRLSAMSKADEL